MMIRVKGRVRRALKTQRLKVLQQRPAIIVGAIVEEMIGHSAVDRPAVLPQLNELVRGDDRRIADPSLVLFTRRDIQSCSNTVLMLPDIVLTAGTLLPHRVF